MKNSKKTKSIRYGLQDALREHFASGQPITRLEAIVLYGVANLPTAVSHLRRQGWVIQSQPIPYAKAVRRISKYAVLQPPSNLPIRDIQLTEYWASF